MKIFVRKGRSAWGVREHLVCLLIVLSAAICTFYLFRNWLGEDRYGTISYVVFMAVLGAIMVILLRGYVTVAKMLLLLSGTGFIFLFASQEPDLPGVYLYFILDSIAALVLFDREERTLGLIFYFISFAFFLIAWYTDYSFFPPHNITPVQAMEFFMTDFIIAYAVIFVIFFVFSGFHFSVENSLQESKADLLQKNKSLEQNNVALERHLQGFEQLSFSLSHHIKGPIASLRGLLELNRIKAASFEEPHMKESLVRLIDELHLAANDLTGIVELRGGGELLQEAIALQDIASDQLLPFAHQYNFVLECNFRQAPVIHTSRLLLTQILGELLINAWQFRAAGRPLTVSVSSYIHGSSIIIKVHDNGLGIDLTAHARHLFKLYKKFHWSTGGRGTGLFMTKARVEALRGTIEITSQPNVGTSVTMAFPIS